MTPAEIRIRVVFNVDEYSYEISERHSGRILVVLTPTFEERREITDLFMNPAAHIELPR
jgi:hypothetical protein